MLTKSFLILFFLLVVKIDAFGASPGIRPPEYFIEKGAWVLLGEIHEVHVVGQKSNYEYGNVVIRVDEVLEGNLNRALIGFPYQKKLSAAMVNPYGWDLVARPEVGKKLLIYFEEKDGTYSLSIFGANPIQEVISFDDPNTAWMDYRYTPPLGPAKIKALREIIRLHRLRR